MLIKTSILITLIKLYVEENMILCSEVLYRLYLTL